MEQWKIEQVSLAGYSFRVENDEFVFIGDAPTSSALDAMYAEYEAKAYARNRASEYPSLLELTVALYDTDDKSAVEAKRAAVKLKYPKPS